MPMIDIIQLYVIIRAHRAPGDLDHASASMMCFLEKKWFEEAINCPCSMDWFGWGNLQEPPGFYETKPWFPVDFPLNQAIALAASRLKPGP